MALLIVFGAVGCAQTGMRTTRVKVGDGSLKVELAESAGQQERGLMYRQKLGRNRGMLFVYDREEVRSFWMKNTYVPLSIAFIDADQKIVHITSMSPRDTDSHSSRKACQYVLEANKGWFDDHGVEVGDVLDFELPEPEENLQ